MLFCTVTFATGKDIYDRQNRQNAARSFVPEISACISTGNITAQDGP